MILVFKSESSLSAVTAPFFILSFVIALLAIVNVIASPPISLPLPFVIVISLDVTFPLLFVPAISLTLFASNPTVYVVPSAPAVPALTVIPLLATASTFDLAPFNWDKLTTSLLSVPLATLVIFLLPILKFPVLSAESVKSWELFTPLFILSVLNLGFSFNPILSTGAEALPPIYVERFSPTYLESPEPQLSACTFIVAPILVDNLLSVKLAEFCACKIGAAPINCE